MNKCIFLGRLTKDIELKQTSTGKFYTKFSLAVDRPFTQGENKQADFPVLVAWNKTAEIMAKYLKKGSQICATCHYTQGKYVNAQGENIYTHEFLVDQFEMCGSRGNNSGAQAQTQPAQVNQPTQPIPPAPIADSADSAEVYEDAGLAAFENFDEGNF